MLALKITVAEDAIGHLEDLLLPPFFIMFKRIISKIKY